MKSSLAVLAALTLGQVACAGVRVTEIRPPVPHQIGGRGDVERTLPAPARTGGLPGGVLDPSVILRVGQALWDIVKANQATAEANYTSAAAVPQGVTSWEALAGWNAQPAVRTVRVRVTDGFDREVARLTYSVIAIYGGGLNGTGRYLQDVRVVPDQLEVAWGYHVDASVAIPGVFNAGTAADPVAAMTLIHRFRVQNPLKIYECSQHFTVRGDGRIDLTVPSPGDEGTATVDTPR